MSAQTKRLCTAAFAIAAVVFAMVSAGSCAPAPEAVTPVAFEAAIGSSNGAHAQDSGADDFARTAFENAGGAQVRWGSLPASFESEVFDPVGMGAVDVAGTEDCAGAVFEGDAVQVASAIEEALRGNGWSHACEGDGDAEGLYRRASGTYRWAFVQCSRSSGSVCVSVSLWKEQVR